MALTNYEGEGEVYVNGDLLAEAKSVSFRTVSNNNKVYTMVKGMAGRSRGPREVGGSIDTAVPVRGYEKNFHQMIVDDETFQLQFVDGGVRYIVDCWFDDADSSRSANTDAGLTANFSGGKPRLL